MPAPVPVRRLACLLAACALLICLPSGAGARPVTVSEVLKAPVRSVKVPWGRIGYRVVGHGAPMVIIMGLAGSIDAWPPSFVTALAARHRVYALDNEGIGLTTRRRGALSIPRMADETADFVRALHLRRPDVLGWSMGGFIAQAYAVRHPRLLRRLVLAATAPGDGHPVFPSAPVIQALSSGSGAGALAYLFPPDQSRYGALYTQQIVRWPGFHLPVAQVVKAQLAASTLWLSGRDQAGRRVSRLRIPVLIGDGAEDVILPTPNTRHLAHLIKGSHLHLYPDAGHGFLFQDERAWVKVINRFLG